MNLLTEEQKLQIPSNRHVRNTIFDLAQRIELCIKIDPDAITETYDLARTDTLVGVYEVEMVRTGTLYDAEWFKGRDCRAWLPELVELVYPKLAFVCRIVNSRAKMMPRIFRIDGSMVQDIWACEAGATSHKVRFVINSEYMSAYLLRITWGCAVTKKVVIGRYALNFLPVPKDVCDRIYEFCKIKVKGIEENQEARMRGARLSIYPYTLKCAKWTNLGNVSKISETSL